MYICTLTYVYYRHFRQVLNSMNSYCLLDLLLSCPLPFSFCIYLSPLLFSFIFPPFFHLFYQNICTLLFPFIAPSLHHNGPILLFLVSTVIPRQVLTSEDLKLGPSDLSFEVHVTSVKPETIYTHKQQKWAQQAIFMFAAIYIYIYLCCFIILPICLQSTLFYFLWS